MPALPAMIGRRPLLGGAAAAALLPLGCATPDIGQQLGAGRAGLEKVASFDGQVTGVAVAPNGRIFVNFPRWEKDVAVSVAEVGPGGALTPYPDNAWNAYRNTTPGGGAQRFVCVQALATDPQGNLWVVDPAAPALGFEVPDGPKLVCIDLARNQVSRIYPFDTSVAPQGTYLNDIRFTADGQRAVLTNSGQPGSLITLDVATGEARRVLDGHPSTQAQTDVAMVVNGHDLRRPDGEPPKFSADGIAIDTQAGYVHWQATTGTTMYRVPLAPLFDPRVAPAELGRMVEVVAQTFIADGYWMARNGTLYVTSCSDNAVKRLTTDRQFAVAVQDSRLLWPDSMAEGADGTLYVTASHIPQMKSWQGQGVSETQLFRFRAA